MKRPIITLLTIILLLATSAQAQLPAVTATVNARKMGIEDTLKVTYTINNSKNIKSVLDIKFRDLNIVTGPYQTQTTNTVRNHDGGYDETNKTTLVYYLSPKHMGKAHVPALTAVDNKGRTYTSNRLKLKVVKGHLLATGNANDLMLDDTVFNPKKLTQQQWLEEFSKVRHDTVIHFKPDTTIFR